MRRSLYILIVLVCSISFNKVLASPTNYADSLQSELLNESLTEDEKAILLSKIGSYYYKQEDYPRAISFKKEAAYKYLELNDEKNTAALYEQIGVVYSLISDHKNSLDYFLKALRIFEEIKDEASTNSVKFNIGTTYVEALNYDKGINYLEDAIGYYRSEENLEYLIAAYTNLGVAHKAKQRPDSAVYYYSLSLVMANKAGVESQIGGTLINLGDLQLTQGNIDEAKESYTQALGYFQATDEKRGIWHSKSGLAEVALRSGETDKGVELIKEATAFYRKTGDYSYLLEGYKTLAEVCEQQGNYQKALEYQMEYGRVKDSVDSKKISNKMADLQMQYDVEKLERENELKIQLLNKEKELSRLRWYVATSVLIAGLILIITLYNRNKNQKKLIELKLAKTTLEKGRLNTELDHRNKELENFALHLVHKNEFLDEVKDHLKEMKKVASDTNLKKLNELNLKINQTLSVNSELEKFYQRVDEMNNNFFNELTRQFPELTEKEKQLCALLKMNLSSKEIASLKNISEGAVTMARYRLRKKLNFHSDDNLSDFFQKFG